MDHDPKKEILTKKDRKIFKTAIQVIFVLAVLTGAYFLAQDVTTNPSIRLWLEAYGYPAVLLLAIISGINIVAPIPAISFLPALLDAGLSFWPLVFLISLGMTIGDMASYVVGRLGKNIAALEKHSFAERLEKLRVAHPYLPLGLLFLFACVAPFPNEVLVLPLSFMGYKPLPIFVIALAGNTVFNTLAGLGVSFIFGQL